MFCRCRVHVCKIGGTWKTYIYSLRIKEEKKKNIRQPSIALMANKNAGGRQYSELAYALGRSYYRIAQRIFRVQSYCAPLHQY